MRIGIVFAFAAVLSLCSAQCGSTGTPCLATSQAPPPPDPSCPCNRQWVWNDVFVLFDASNFLTASQFDEMVSFVYSALAQLNIGQSAHATRVGVATYANAAIDIAPLNKYASLVDMFNDIENVQHTNETSTNVRGAIDLARDHFASSEHRNNARKVIILASSTYRDGNYQSPMAVAETFKDNGGVIIVLNYGDNHGSTHTILQQIASPGFYVDASSGTPDMDAFVNLQCRANCFCASPYKAIPTSYYGEPSVGCFYVSEAENDFDSSNISCSTLSNGHLAEPFAVAERVFVTGGQKSAPIWVGLQLINGQWRWASDQTAYQGNILVDGTGECAYLQQTGMGFGTQIVQSSCVVPRKYSCQATPCSSTNYCN